MKRIALLLAVAVLLAGCAGPAHWMMKNNDRATLYLKAPEAEEVFFLCSQDGFRPRRADRQGGGVWATTIETGREFTYFYLVDGQAFTPDCELTATDDFGSRNCIFSPGL